MKRFAMLFAGLAILLAVTGAANAQARLSTEGVRALYAALDDERQNEAQYKAVLGEFGLVSPFSQIMVAEQRHQEALIRVMQRHQLRIPPNPYRADQFAVPETLEECCALGVRAELANVAMYREFLKLALPNDVRNVFTNLMTASLEKHLPAFQACACDCDGSGGGGTGIQQRDRDRTSWE